MFLQENSMKTLVDKDFAVKLITNILLAVIGTIVVFLPDYLFALFESYIVPEIDLEYAALICFLCFGLISTKNTKLIIFTILILAILEIIQLSHLAYFGVQIFPRTFGWMFSESKDVIEVVIDEAADLVYAPLVVLVPYSLFVTILLFGNQKRLIIPFSYLPIVITISLLAYNLYADEIPRRDCFPDKRRDTFRNVIYASMSYAVHDLIVNKVLNSDLKAAQSKLEYKPYVVENKGILHDKLTIVVIIGESITHRHMGLFGYHRDTTPKLNSLKDNTDFIYKKSVASGVNTYVGFTFFMNLQRDPRNYDVVLSNRYNLLNLAKKNAFKTVFVSSQTGVAAYMPRRYIDEYLIRDQENIAPLFDRMHDEALLKILSNLDLENRNLIILHQRNAHAPYYRNYRHRVNEFEKFSVDDEDRHKRKTLNTYDNATLYNDSFIYDAIEYVRKNIDGSVYMFYTSDHGENLGEEGLWGHGMLTPATADIPFLAYSKNGDKEYIERLKSMSTPTHFDIGVLIAELLGYKISDPNTPDGTYYINGKGIAGELDFIKYNKGAGDRIVYAESN